MRWKALLKHLATAVVAALASWFAAAAGGIK